MKIKIRRKKKALSKWYICIFLLIILIFSSIAYSLWSTDLYIYGQVSGEYSEEPDLPVEIPSQGEDSNGVNRFTSSSNITALGQEIYRVTLEEYEGNTITTTIQHIYKQSTSWFYPTATITLTIPNDNSLDLTDGTIELTESNDPNSIFQNVTYTLSDTTITAGGTTTATISGKLRGNQTVGDNTYYKFTINYNIGNVKFYFYYTIILLPIS